MTPLGGKPEGKALSDGGQIVVVLGIGKREEGT